MDFTIRVNLLQKYGILYLWEDNLPDSEEDFKVEIKNIIWKYHWENDMTTAKACHTPFSRIFLINTETRGVETYYRPHSLLRSLKSMNLSRSTLSKALRYWTTPIRRRRCFGGQTTDNLPRHLCFSCPST